MSDVNFLSVFVRWVHIGSVIGLVGGAFFLRFVLMPAAANLPEEAHNSLRKWVMDRWKLFVHPLVGLIFLSGIYNLVVRVTKVEPIWHMLFGVKLLLALYVLFVASALVGRSKGLEKLRVKSPLFLLINIILAGFILLLSSIMKNIPEKTPKPETPAASSMPAEAFSQTFMRV